MISQKSSNYEENFMQHRLEFTDSLKDLRNIRTQLYSAAEYLEASYDKKYQKQFVLESSKEYVARAIVSTVDHLGSVADKINKFLDQKSNEFSATTIRFSSIEQRLNTFRGFMELRGISQQWLMLDTPKHHKHYIIPAGKDKETFQLGESKVLYRNCISCPQNDMQRSNNQENSISVAYRAARIKPSPPLLRKVYSSWMPSKEPSPNPSNFSFTRVMPNKESGKRRSVSPFRFPLKRSVSPSPSINKPRSPSEPRRPIHAYTKPEMTNKESEIEAYTKKSRHLFKALLSGHASGRDVALNRLYGGVGH